MGQGQSGNTGRHAPNSSSDSQGRHYELRPVEEDGIQDILQEFAISAVLGITVYCASTYLIRKFQDDGDSQPVDAGKVAKALRRRKRKNITMNKYEKQVAVDFVDPLEMNVAFDDIGGLEKQKEEIYKLLILPLKRPELFRSRKAVLKPPAGVMFYGEPGCGKTMLAQAVAKECGFFFLNLRLSTLQNKWYGESVKMARAVFSLARKLSPCVIFIDEMDIFLRERGRSGGHSEASAHVKGEFLTEWDGLLSQVGGDGNGVEVIVMGATNRPSDVDPAFLRRMPARFEVRLPSLDDRASILRAILKGSLSEEELKSLNFKNVASHTDGFSGSDLKELCRVANMSVVMEAAQGTGDKLRPLRTSDFVEAIKSVKSTNAGAEEFREWQYQHTPEPNNPRINTNAATQEMLAQLLAMMMASSNNNAHR